MSFINNKGHGHTDVAAAVSYQTDFVVLASDAEAYSRELGNRGMPRVTVYLQQTVGAIPAQATVEFSTSDQTNKIKTWFPATTAVPTPLNVPVLVPVQLPAKFIRVSFVRPAAQATSIEVVLMVAQ
jgi:hypothetical protein